MPIHGFLLFAIPQIIFVLLQLLGLEKTSVLSQGMSYSSCKQGDKAAANEGTDFHGAPQTLAFQLELRPWNAGPQCGRATHYQSAGGLLAMERGVWRSRSRSSVSPGAVGQTGDDLNQLGEPGVCALFQPDHSDGKGGGKRQWAENHRGV